MISKTKELYYHFIGLGDEDSEKKAKLIRHRRQRKELFKENDELTRDEFMELINHCLQEIRLLGHGHQLVIFPQNHQDIMEQWSYEDEIEHINPMQSHKWDQYVYLAFSNSVDTITFIDVSESPLTTPKDF